MAMITKTIKPGGGGDYTSLASAVAGIAYSVGDTINFTCFAGEIGWSDLTQLAAHVTLVADAGAKHNGRSSQSLSGIARLTDTVGMGSSGSYTYTIDGIRVEILAASNFDIEMPEGDANSFVIKNCLLSGDTQGLNAFYFVNFGGVNPLTFQNNAMLVIDSTEGGMPCIWIAATSTGTTASTNVKFVGNSGIATGFAYGVAFVADGSGGTSAITLTCQDNFLDGSAGGDFLSLPSNGGTITAAAGGYNGSSDGTSTTFGVTGCLTGLTAANLFVDPLTDLHLKSGSVLKKAGIAVAGLTTDNQGKTRPNPPSIGAFEAASGNAILGNGLI